MLQMNATIPNFHVDAEKKKLYVFMLAKKAPCPIISL
jgi:hypothetical protein